MACRCICSLTPILAIAGLLGLGAAGYRVANGGCSLCHKDAAATTKLVSASEPASLGKCGNDRGEALDEMAKADGAKPACCAGMSKAECIAKMGECPAHGGCCDHKDQAKPADAPEKVATTGK